MALMPGALYMLPHLFFTIMLICRYYCSHVQVGKLRLRGMRYFPLGHTVRARSTIESQVCLFLTSDSALGLGPFAPLGRWWLMLTTKTDSALTVSLWWVQQMAYKIQPAHP